MTNRDIILIPAKEYADFVFIHEVARIAQSNILRAKGASETNPLTLAGSVTQFRMRLLS